MIHLTNMYVRIALWLALIACIDGGIIKLKEVPFQTEGLTLDIIVRNKGDRNVVSTFNIDVDEVNKKVTMSMAEETASPVGKNGIVMPETGVPAIDGRFLIRGGNCPIGYHKRGGFCFPSDN